MANNFNLTIVSPDGKKLSKEVSIVNVVTTNGSVGILANHLPLIAIVEISHLNYKNFEGSFDVAVNGGVLNVNNNEVIVLAESFETKEEIDINRANASKERALERLKDNTNIDVLRAETSLKRALNRLSL